MLKKLVIDRSKWACGKPPDNADDNCLLNDNGMCCLGFYARQAGYAAKTIREAGMPSVIYEESINDKKRNQAKQRFDKLLNQKGDDSVSALELAKVNDSENYGPEGREAAVAALFKKLGTRVVFTGKYRKPKAA